MPRGGHFAAFEEPQLLAEDIISFVNKIGKEQDVHDSGPFILRQLLKFIDAFKISVTNSVIETARNIPDLPVVVDDPNVIPEPRDPTKDPVKDTIVELDAAMKRREEKKEKNLDEQYIVEEILKKIPAQRDDDIDEDDIREMIGREKKKKRKGDKRREKEEREKSKRKEKSKRRDND